METVFSDDFSEKVQHAQDVLATDPSSEELHDAIQNVIDRIQVQTSDQRPESTKRADDSSDATEALATRLFPATDPLFLVLENANNKKKEFKQYQQFLY